MQLFLKDDLPFTTVEISYLGNEIMIDHVLIDTGSATTIFSADVLARIKIFPKPNDKLFTIRGIGGGETVFSS